jgi:hypothetical protein
MINPLPLADLNPADEADLRISLERRHYGEALDRALWMARYDIARFTEIEGVRWRAMIARDLTEGYFDPSLGFFKSSPTREEVLAKWEEDSQMQGIFPNQDLAWSYLTEVSDYAIWKIAEEVEQAGRDDLADHCSLLAAGDDRARLVGKAVRKHFLAVIDRIILKGAAK